MNAKPIIFSAPMVRALLAGTKTQTRRIVKPLTKRHPVVNLREHDDKFSGRFSDPHSWGYAYAEDGNHMPLDYWMNLCPYGKPGDLLWVREAQAIIPCEIPKKTLVIYAATEGVFPNGAVKFKPSIHMPRWASRLTLELIDVRVQRLQEISEEDAIAEGVDAIPLADVSRQATMSRRADFAQLWNKINGAGTWDANPWVWALMFKVHRINVDGLLEQREACVA